MAFSGAIAFSLSGRTGTRRAGERRARGVVACNAGLDLSGKWGCFKTEGDIDAYWKACGLPWFARKGLEAMDWGAGKNTNYREFTQDGDSITMEYSFDGPGMGGLSFTERYVVGNGMQEINRMGGATILVDPIWDGGSLKITNRTPPESAISFGFVPKAFRKLFEGKGSEEVPEDEQVDEEAPRGEMLDVHTFVLDGETLVMTADSSASGGPVVRWFLKKE